MLAEFQGPETNIDDVIKISEAVRKGSDIRITLINYKKNGTKFWNQLELFTLKNSWGCPTLCIGLQTEVFMEKAIIQSDDISIQHDQNIH